MPLARRANQVELRLTANLQLQPLPQLVTWIVRAPPFGASFSIRYTKPSTVLVGLRSTAPLRRASRSGRFQPRTEHATKPLTSSFTIPGGPDLAIGSPSPRVARSASAAASSKDDNIIGSGRLPSTRAPSPGRSALARATHGITRFLPVSLLACSWLSPLRSGFSAASPTEPPRRESSPARPHPSHCLAACEAGTKRCSSTSATQTLREHNHGIDRSPLSEPGARAPERALARSARLVGLRSHRLSPGERLLLESRLSPRCSVTGGRRLALAFRKRPGILRPQAPSTRRERHDRQPRFTGQGPGGFRRRHLSLPGSGFRRWQGPRSSLMLVLTRR
jgi:hypothetical protein